MVFARPQVEILIRMTLSRLRFTLLPLFRGHCAISQGVTESSPLEVDFFSLPNPSSRTVALGSTQPLTEMSTRNFHGG
jgi:hypothetical protein